MDSRHASRQLTRMARDARFCIRVIPPVLILGGRGTRPAIFAAVCTEPGINKNQICTLLGKSWGTIRYHVDALTKQGFIHVEHRGRCHGLYPGTTPALHRNWLRALHDQHTATILQALLVQPRVGVYEMSHKLGISQKVIRNRLARLLVDGLVSKRGSARPRYGLSESSQEVRSLLDQRLNSRHGETTKPNLHPPK